MPNTTTREYIMNSLEEYDEEATQFFDAHDYASHDAEGYEESGDPTYYNDDWSMTYDGTEYSLSMIRLGTGGTSDRSTSIHHLEKIEETMEEAFIGSFGSSTTELFDSEKNDGLLIDSGAALNVCPKHSIRPQPDTCNSELRMDSEYSLTDYAQ